jgi:hypothetical protein
MAENRRRVHQGTRDYKLKEIELITWNNGLVDLLPCFWTDLCWKIPV